MYKKRNSFDVTLETLELLSSKLNSLKERLSKKTCFLGFDGYIDSLYSLCKSRDDVSNWTRMDTMKFFGETVSKVAGSSANIERVLKRKISGGFAPNSCKAINAIGLKVILVAALGFPKLHNTFKSLASTNTIEVISLSEPGETVGLEFDDGKIMLTDFGNIFNISWELLLERVGFQKIIEKINASDIMGFGHWALVPAIQNIWYHFEDEIFPKITSLKNKLFFVDLADIKKRSKNDILQMLKTLQNVDQQVPVMLSLNDQEAIDISNALDNVKKIDPNKKNFEDYVKGGKLINDKLNLSYLVIHSPHFATISTKKDHFWITEGFASKPKFTTGAGDHFHSGVAAGLACNLTPPEAILMGNALTAIFVRTGKSPNFEELSHFIINYMDYVEQDVPDFKFP